MLEIDAKLSSYKETGMRMEQQKDEGKEMDEQLRKRLFEAISSNENHSSPMDRSHNSAVVD